MADNHSEGECNESSINPILESSLGSPQLLRWITTMYDDDETGEEEGRENEQQQQISRGRCG